QVDTRFKDYDEQAVFQNPNFYDENLDGAKGYQLLASSPAIDAGIPYSGKYAHPPIPVGDSDIFSNIEAIPSVGFFDRSLTVNSTPNIGANNAKNGEITSLYNLENPLIRDLFNNQEIQFENVYNEFNYRLFDITGKEKKSGTINSSNSKIQLKNNLENGVYSISIENDNQKISQKFIYRKTHS
ncbi:MAG: T9SS C-terminal target domain-containing protein, partial [Cryomorphaceae bacterium]